MVKAWGEGFTRMIALPFFGGAWEGRGIVSRHKMKEPRAFGAIIHTETM
jgi:hypothetical protein